MKMLMFDFRDSEKEYFNKHDLPDFDIEFFNEPLNEMSNLTEEQFEIYKNNLAKAIKHLIDVSAIIITDNGISNDNGLENSVLDDN